MRVCAIAAWGGARFSANLESLVGVSFQMSFGAVIALDRGLRDLGRPPRPTVARPLAVAAPAARLLRRGRGDDGGRDPRHLPVLRSADVHHIALLLLAARQRHRGAPLSAEDVDDALGRGHLPR